MDELLSRQVDALIVWAIPGQLRDPRVIQRLQVVPTVAVCREAKEDLPGDLVIHDRNQAIRDAVDHLVDTGRTRPAFAIGMTQESNPPKYQAFLEHCRRRGVADHTHQLINLPHPSHAEATGQNYTVGMANTFGDHVDVDAIFCFNDVGAMYVMRDLSARGLRVPEDVAVIGFNDDQAGRVWDPPLATGDRKPREVAAAVDQMLNRRLENPDRPPQRNTVHMQFIWRASAGGPPPTDGAAAESRSCTATQRIQETSVPSPEESNA
jgi:DNA-binding LacI/PurR family transcriptional regulator